MGTFKELVSLGKGLTFYFWLELGRRLARLARLQLLYSRLLSHFVARTDLFDEGFYRENNPDVVEDGWDPLLHYVAYGDREGRLPLAIFDPCYYREHAGKWYRGGNTLLHYYYVGRHLGISPSPWFDVAFYLAQNKDVARAGQDPLLHYLRHGGLEGRSPCSHFDGDYYLQSSPDVAEARVNPLLHYLDFGRLEGRAILPPTLLDDEEEPQGADPTAAQPGEEDWAAITAREVGKEVVVDVIVPVYRGRVETLRCLYSVLASRNRTAFELVVINDASPDPNLAEDLRRLAARGLLTLLENEANRGFVHTANRGMVLHADRDVLLLNSDTEVYGDWLDRLRRTAWRDVRTGTVTPLSNNATICSYPRFLHDNPYPLDLGYESLDALAAEVNSGLSVETPTAVGFCIYIRRDCLADVGLFDEQAFGKGYGEENDFSQRAIAKQWRNLIAADVFVRHWGSTSFQGEKAKRVHAALKVLDKRHPDYRRDVEQFVKEDELAGARRRLDWARLKKHGRNENVLIVCHNRGGGSERHVQEDTRQLLAGGGGVFYLRPQKGRPTHVRISHPKCRFLPNIGRFRLADTESLGGALEQLGITRIHAHGLVDFTHDAGSHVRQLADALGVPLWVDIHDYKVICPRINLADRNGIYCGEPEDESQCNRCLIAEGNDFGVRDIREWRQRHHRVLKRAERIFVPDLDVAERLQRYYPDIECLVDPHERIDFELENVRAPVLPPGDRLRIVAIGAIGKIKGYDILLACAKDAQKRKLPIDFSILGYSLDDQALKQAGVEITGRYLEHEADEKLARLSPHLVWLPSLWPETYSYTLSVALKNGCPVASFDIGAIAARLRRLEQTDFLMPLELSKRPQDLNDFFLKRIRECAGALGKPHKIAETTESWGR